MLSLASKNKTLKLCSILIVPEDWHPKTPSTEAYIATPWTKNWVPLRSLTFCSDAVGRTSGLQLLVIADSSAVLWCLTGMQVRDFKQAR